MLYSGGTKRAYARLSLSFLKRNVRITKNQFRRTILINFSYSRDCFPRIPRLWDRDQRDFSQNQDFRRKESWTKRPDTNKKGVKGVRGPGHVLQQ